MIKSPWVWIHEKLTTGIHGVGAGTVGIKDKDTKILDADADTGFEVEQSADEDKIHGKVAGAEVFAHTATGLTLAKQARAKAYADDIGDQILPTATHAVVKLSAESFDIQNEFDTSIKTGTADATEANKLHDADGGFASGDVGKQVWNTTDNTYTTVSAFVNSGELTLTDDIMVDTEGYDLYFSRYTATEAGTYLITATYKLNILADGTYANLFVRVNGVSKYIARMSAGGAVYGQPLGVLEMELSANDYVDFRAYHNVGSNQNITDGEISTSLAVSRLY